MNTNNTDRKQAGRRRFLKRFGIGLGVCAGIYTEARYIEPRVLDVSRHVAYLPELPLALDGLLVAHLSDLHHGPITPVETIRDAVTAVVEASPGVVMLTGDGKTTAEAVGRELGIKEVIADVFPKDKAAVVARLKKEGRVVAMAGDGVNDAPALAAADVGIAMGTGTDVAMQSSGVTLLKGDLMGLVHARELSQATMRNIRQNLVLSFVYNAAGIPIAAGVLYPFFGLLLSPVVASGAMALSSVSVIVNSLRLRSAKLKT